jgi:hypothetical protein
MQVLAIFTALSLMLEASSVFISATVENYSPSGSLFVFLGLFVLSFVIAWKLAVYLTERFLVSDAQRIANEEHVKWVNAKVAQAGKVQASHAFSSRR